MTWAPFETADQRLAPRPVIKTDPPGLRHCLLGRGPNASRESVLAHRQHKPSGKRLRGAPAESKAKVTHQFLQAERAPRMRLGDGRRKSLGEKSWKDKM